MLTTPVGQAHHLRRKAVLDMRPATGPQGLTNPERQQLQRAMREPAPPRRARGAPRGRRDRPGTHGPEPRAARWLSGTAGRGGAGAGGDRAPRCEHPLVSEVHRLGPSAGSGCLECGPECGARWGLRCRPPPWPSLGGPEGDRERERAPHLPGPADRRRAAAGPARGLGAGLPGWVTAPKRRRRGARPRPSRAAGHDRGLPDVLSAPIRPASGTLRARSRSATAPASSPLRPSVAHPDGGGGADDRAQSGLGRRLGVWPNADAGATGRGSLSAASTALITVASHRARP